jgi:hypothetical protein
MSTARIRLPDGRIATVSVPDGMESSALQAEVQSLYERGAFDKKSEPEGKAVGR